MVDLEDVVADDEAHGDDAERVLSEAMTRQPGVASTRNDKGSRRPGLTASVVSVVSEIMAAALLRVKVDERDDAADGPPVDPSCPPRASLLAGARLGPAISAVARSTDDRRAAPSDQQLNQTRQQQPRPPRTARPLLPPATLDPPSSTLLQQHAAFDRGGDEGRLLECVLPCRLRLNLRQS